MQHELSGKRVLVTGGTGFIGAKVVETLVLEIGAKVRVLTHNLAHAARIARLPVEIVRGDVTDASDVQRSIDGCDVVFHCAYGNEGSKNRQRRVNIHGTRNVVMAASQAGVQRVVHVSTVAVCGHMKSGELDESSPLRYTGDTYGDSKLDAEKNAFSLASKLALPLAVVRPTVVYGPYSPTWTIGVISQLRTGRVILLNGGEGLCNAVYIDDVVQAMLLAAVRDEAVGEAFLISSDRPVTWKDFYQSFERMLGASRTVNMSTLEARAYLREWKKARSFLFQLLTIPRQDPQFLGRLLRTNEMEALAGLAEPLAPQLKKILGALLRLPSPDRPDAERGGGPIHPLDSWAIRLFESRARVKIDKAKRVLGYQPAFDFKTGMELTERWARWANLIGA